MNKLRSYFIFLSLAFVTVNKAEASVFCEQAIASTDRDYYLAGERMQISVSITDGQGHLLDQSRVAYIELSDTHRIWAQGMVALRHGQGWSALALPSTMHSGCYLLTIYTRAMLNQPNADWCRHVIAVVNPRLASEYDNVIYHPTDSIPASAFAPSDASVLTISADSLTIHIPDNWVSCFTSASLIRRDVLVPDYAGYHPEVNVPMLNSNPHLRQPELEGHIVMARPTSDSTGIDETRLVMVGKRAALYDGQLQPDGTYLYYTLASGSSSGSGVSGRLATLLSAYDADGRVVGIQFVSPYAHILPRTLPPLHVYCNEVDLNMLSITAQQEEEISQWLALDTLPHTQQFLAAEPTHVYDLDEYTRFNTVREVISEFIQGVTRQRQNKVNQLYVFDRQLGRYADIPALVMLDGVPIHDIDEILNYDARFLKYIQVYDQRFTFGHVTCGGAVSLITRHGLLTNYTLDAGSQLVSYDFPQDRPDFFVPPSTTNGTLQWYPLVSRSVIHIPAPTIPGPYMIILHGLNIEGQPVTQRIPFSL